MNTIYPVYRVCERSSGNVVFEGTSRECAERFGRTQNYIAECARGRKYLCGKYRVTPLDELPKTRKKPGNGETLYSAAKKWDEFVTPLRKKYGIPVYKAKPEVRR